MRTNRGIVEAIEDLVEKEVKSYQKEIKALKKEIVRLQRKREPVDIFCSDILKKGTEPISTEELFVWCLEWCEENGLESPSTKNLLGRRLSRNGFEKIIMSREGTSLAAWKVKG